MFDVSVLVPVALTADILTSSVAENDYLPHNPGTTYGNADVDRCISTVTHRIYQSLRTGNIGHDPTDPVNRAGEAAWWLDIGATNKMKMFDDQVASQTVAVSPLVVVLSPGPVNALDLRGILADGATVVVKDAPGGNITKTFTSDLESSEPPDYYEYWFDRFQPQTDFIVTGLEPYSDMEITITLTAAGGTVKCGMVSVGDLRPLGKSIKGAKAKPKSNSRVTINEFGDGAIQRRGVSAPDLSFSALVELDYTASVMDTLIAVLDIPCVVVVTESVKRSWLRAFGLLSAELDDAHSQHAVLTGNVQGFK